MLFVWIVFPILNMFFAAIILPNKFFLVSPLAQSKSQAGRTTVLISDTRK